MAITKEEIMDSVTIKDTGHVEIRVTTIILDNKKEIARSYFRRVINPEDEITDETDQIKQICKIARGQ